MGLVEIEIDRLDGGGQYELDARERTERIAFRLPGPR